DARVVLVTVSWTRTTAATLTSDLKPYRRATETLTTSYDITTNLIKPTKEPGAYNSLSDAVAAINAHQVDGLVVDYPTALYIADPYVQEVKNSVVVGQLPAAAQYGHL